MDVKVSKVSKIIGALKSGEYTVQELVEISEASVNTVKIQVNFALRKKGFIIKVNDVEGVKKYSIIPAPVEP